MTSIFPIPTTRSSGVLVRQRLLAQLQSDQLALLRTQDQLSTGRRIIVPSDDAPAALRAVGLQKLLEQKAQARTHLGTAHSYLPATENSLAGASDLLREARASALGVVNVTASDTERQAAAQEILRSLEQFVAIGNQQFRGRSLFAGSQTTTTPFERVGPYVAYNGNEATLQSFADLGLLTETSISGHTVFGAFSTQKQGTADFDPIVTEKTRLADLRGGLGIRTGSFTISDGVSTSTIDIRGAETVGDVIRLIERNPPAGRQATVRIVNNRLEVRLDAAGGGNLRIREVGGGTTASELGILAQAGVGTAPVIGKDLNPLLRKTTSLENVLGTRAVARLESPGANNDLLLTFRDRGAAGNGYSIQLVDDSLLQAAAGLTAGNETATLSAAPTAARASLALLGGDNDLLLTAVTPGSQLNNLSIVFDSSQNLGDAATASLVGNVLTLHIDDSDETSLASLITAIEDTGLFTVSADSSAGEGHDLGSAVTAANAGAVSGNTGVSGGAANTIVVNIAAGQSTAAQIAAALEANPQIAALLQVSFDPKDTLPTIDPGAGVVAAGAVALSSGGSGVEPDLTSGLQVVNGGQTYTIDLSDARTVEDLLNTLNGSPAYLLATINAAGTGIDIRSRLSGADFSIGENGGLTATHLGVRTFTGETTLAELNHGIGVMAATGTDFTITLRDGATLDIDVSGAEIGRAHV